MAKNSQCKFEDWHSSTSYTLRLLVPESGYLYRWLCVAVSYCSSGPCMDQQCPEDADITNTLSCDLYTARSYYKGLYGWISCTITVAPYHAYTHDKWQCYLLLMLSIIPHWKYYYCCIKSCIEELIYSFVALLLYRMRVGYNLITAME